MTSRFFSVILSWLSFNTWAEDRFGMGKWFQLAFYALCVIVWVSFGMSIAGLLMFFYGDHGFFLVYDCPPCPVCPTTVPPL